MREIIPSMPISHFDIPKDGNTHHVAVSDNRLYVDGHRVRWPRVKRHRASHPETAQASRKLLVMLRQ